MAKKKQNQNFEGFTSCVIEHSKISCEEIFDNVNRYMLSMDNSRLTQTTEKEIEVLYKKYPHILGIIACAFFESGYNSF